MLRDDFIRYGVFDKLSVDILDFKDGWTDPHYGVHLMIKYYKIGRFDLCSDKVTGMRKRVELLRKRLAELEAIEAEHGKGCLLDLDNYFVQQIIEAGGLSEEKENAVRYRKAMMASSSVDV